MLKIVCRGKCRNKETNVEPTVVIKVRNDGGLDVTVMVLSFLVSSQTGHPIQFAKINAPNGNSQWSLGYTLQICKRNKK